MYKRQILTGLLTLVIVGLLAGCGQGTAITEEGAVEAAVREAGDKITAEAAVEPARWVVLRLGGSGAVTEVLVEEGDLVAAGDVLLRIDTTDAQLAVQQAEAALAAAQEQIALVKAGARPEQIGVIEAQLEAAEAAVSQAAAQRDEQNAGLVEADIVAAQAQVVAAASTHRQADEAHDETMKCYTLTLPDGAKEEICPALGDYEEMARDQMEATHAALVAAQAQLDMLQGTTNPQAAAAQAGVQAAVAQRDAVQAQLDLAQAGSRAQEIALAEAGVQQAEAALAQARAQFNLTVLEAPFDGSVTDLPFDAGDTVAPGEPLATLATLDRLQIKTTDLTELDAVRVAVGQPVIVTLDAMTDRPLAGHVVRVDRQSTDHHGDVTYPVIIELDEAPPDWLRWGMTAQVEIQMSSSPISAAPVETIGGGQEVENTIIAEAAVEPERWSGLQFVAPGEVMEVLVAVDDQVAAGDILARLDETHAALAVQEAEAALATAQAQLALKQAGPRAEEIATAEAELEAAQSNLRQAVALRNQLASGAAEAGLSSAQAQLEAAQAERRQAQQEVNWADDSDDRDRKTQAQEQLDAANLQVAAAEARLAAQPKASAAQLRAANAGAQAAQAQADVAQAQLDLLEAGPTAEEIAIAEADVQQAEAALSAAQVARERATLRAPFAGTVTQAHIKVGDAVAPGQVVLVLAALDRLQIKTTDLTELDIASVAEGQPVVVTVDALPEEEFAGVVRKITLQPGNYRGDVVYAVSVDLTDAADSRLRWGMTTVVKIEAN